MLRICALFVLVLMPVAAAAEFSGPVRVVDGDTWQVGAVRVRLHGIDAPEQGQTCTTEQGIAWACGRWVTDRARDRFDGRTATCQPVDTDRYGRTVATCAVDGHDAARALVADGLALAYRRYSDAYAGDEARAAAADLGLHAMRLQAPSQFRRAQRTAATPASAPTGCAIKGNLSRSGARIYHLPGQRDYDRTRIDSTRGERWFCTEAAARAAGWRRARR